MTCHAVLDASKEKKIGTVQRYGGGGGGGHTACALFNNLSVTYTVHVHHIECKNDDAPCK